MLRDEDRLCVFHSLGEGEKQKRLFCPSLVGIWQTSSFNGMNVLVLVYTCRIKDRMRWKKFYLLLYQSWQVFLWKGYFSMSFSRFSFFYFSFLSKKICFSVIIPTFHKWVKMTRIHAYGNSEEPLLIITFLLRTIPQQSPFNTVRPCCLWYMYYLYVVLLRKQRYYWLHNDYTFRAATLAFFS